MTDKADFSPRAAPFWQPFGTLNTFYTNLTDGPHTREISFTSDGRVCTSNNPFPAGALVVAE